MTAPDPHEVVVVDAAPDADVVLVGSDSGPPAPLAPSRPIARAGGEVEQLRSNGVAARALSGHRLLTPSRDGLVYADPSDLDHLHAPLWLSLGAAAGGAQVPMLLHGETSEASWQWEPGPLYLGAAGRLTQTAPAAPEALFSVQVGAATSPTSVFLHQQPSIRLHP
ncbi:hypothetical protein Ae168Ps1_6387c [Pseudonocardia sp. Ae168_Ps1]|uniref:hypothetical protein n=1 Tax=unclassified Pseudonocardia TaxID=2619320 RepID=UPI00094AA9D9|nr:MULTISPECIES: hypothetical protein [unclassified Pseudonocardia]OLL69830.1 hypothetical protein Ae150APs1_6241c [Pseudonocardia sp. Ae150A_Ps1]OLL69962.1 hypothetical protein Ae168Ps1_6387c [Pseudonocardia sp. Ae168_Ps1]OLL89123.1 hypothetical protein Ae356Ps1_6240c [Pseudonocardia sp. Ae356_Ps1]